MISHFNDCNYFHSHLHQHVTVIHWVPVGVSVDRQEISVHVIQVILVPSVISVILAIMDFQTAGVSTYLVHSSGIHLPHFLFLCEITFNVI